MRKEGIKAIEEQGKFTTNEDGEFEMQVKLNDRLIFSSVQYQIRSLVITKEILQKAIPLIVKTVKELQEEQEFF